MWVDGEVRCYGGVMIAIVQHRVDDEDALHAAVIDGAGTILVDPGGDRAGTPITEAPGEIIGIWLVVPLHRGQAS